MDFALRCNSLKCRAQLADEAVVTTCSHIFCLPCADALGMSNANSATRTCPACNTHLVNQDDAAVTNLNPTEDYKTSVLSGLSPSIIIECASRAMAFWTYQTTQEVFYQEFLMKSMTEKYHSLSAQMDKLIVNANSEVSSLRDKIAATQLDNKDLESKNEQLAEAYKKKCKDNGQLHKLYQQAKQRQVTESMAEAAEQDASNVVHSLGRDFNISAPASYMHAQQSNQAKARSDGSVDLRFGTGRAQGHRPPAALTTTTNRTQLPPLARDTGFLFRNQNESASRLDSQRLATPFRQPLADLNVNAHGSSNSFNTRNGMKFGRPPQGDFYQTRSHGGSAFGGGR